MQRSSNLNIPTLEILSDEKVAYYFQELQNGNMNARKTLIEHNLPLVLFLINRHFSSTKEDIEDLFIIGSIGLMKSVDTFDVTRKIKFSVYAQCCIRNEILMHLRKKRINSISLDHPDYDEFDDFSKTIEESLEDHSTNIEKDYEEKELNHIINQYIEGLSYRDREIIKLYFGFYDNNPKDQTEVGKLLGIDQTAISRNLKRIIESIKNELYDEGLLSEDILRAKIKKLR